MMGAGAGPVVVVGDVMVDVVARLGGPLEHATDTDADIGIRPGGGGANTAAWLADAGVPTTIIGAVGDDALGRDQLDDLRRRGIRTAVAVVPDRATGTVIALIDATGERTFITARGANADLGAAPPVPGEPGQHLHLSGYSLLGGATHAAAAALLAAALSSGMAVSVDTGSMAPLRRAGGAAWLAWTAGAAVCFANLEEGRTVTGRHRPGEVATALGRHYREVVLKLGAAGSLLYCDHRLHAVPAPAADVVDTVGAGDALAAGYLAARRAGADPAEALAAGSRTAARAVGVRGGRPPRSRT
jgi:ribokinase